MKSKLLRKFIGVAIVFLMVQKLLYAQWTNISGVINKHVEVIDVDYCNSQVRVLEATGLSVGDKVLIIQMNGAKLDTTNSSTSGSIVNYNNTGNFELCTIWAMDGTSIYMEKKLARNYSCAPHGRVQLVRVPQYTNANVTGTITTNPWNGYRGGVIALIVSDTLRFQDSNVAINADWCGFREGPVSSNAPGAYSELGYYFSNESDYSGGKGEGMGHDNYIGSSGRGPSANGGGGGNAQSSGGGGGGNYGVGGAGGDQYKGIAELANGGYGGRAIPYEVMTNRVFLGGSGGGGHQAHNLGQKGKSGGGIIIIRAKVLVGNNGHIQANGQPGDMAFGFPHYDGGGGGGAGGSILLDVMSFPLGTGFTIQAKGDHGGYVQSNPLASVPANECYGPGGGGGGGLVWVQNASDLALDVHRTVSIAGGGPGLVSSSAPCNFQPFGATSGAPGAIIEGVHIPEGTQPR